MSHSIQRLVSLTVLASGLVLSPIAFSHEGPQANEGYWGDMNGHIINCWHTIYFDQEKHGVEACGEGTAKPKAKAKAKPAPHVSLKTVSLGAHALFDVNKDTLRAAGRQELDALANDLHAVKEIKHITIVGHTDSTGAEGYNQALSERRAASVRHYLISKGVNSNVISSIGKGESSPVDSNANSAGRQKNRRVDINISAIK